MKIWQKNPTKIKISYFQDRLTLISTLLLCQAKATMRPSHPTPPDLRKVLTPEQVRQYQAKASGLTLSCATELVSDEILEFLQELAKKHIGQLNR